MKIVEFAEVSPEVLKELKSADLRPIILNCENGNKVVGYLVDDENNFWGIKIQTNDNKSHNNNQSG